MPSNHTAIHGPAGPSRTEMVDFFLAEDTLTGTASWLIDIDETSLPICYDLALSTTEIGAARRMLSAAATVSKDDPPVTITIEDAHLVLADQACRVLTEQAIRLDTVTFRLVAPNLTPSSFGGSTRIRDAVLQGSRYAVGLAVA